PSPSCPSIWWLPSTWRRIMSLAQRRHSRIICAARSTVLSGVSRPCGVRRAPLRCPIWNRSRRARVRCNREATQELDGRLCSNGLCACCARYYPPLGTNRRATCAHIERLPLALKRELSDVDHDIDDSGNEHNLSCLPFETQPTAAPQDEVSLEQIRRRPKATY